MKMAFFGSLASLYFVLHVVKLLDDMDLRIECLLDMLPVHLFVVVETYSSWFVLDLDVAAVCCVSGWMFGCRLDDLLDYHHTS